MDDSVKKWILENMRYDGDTGVLERRLGNGIWRVCSNRGGSGKGYATVRVFGKTYKYHRICWLLANGGIDQRLVIDHINGNKVDNRLCNLRLVTNTENLRNSKSHRNGRLLGCYWNKKDKRWRAQIIIDGKLKYLGNFSTEIEAHEAYLAALPS